jgi:hypothetical protein
MLDTSIVMHKLSYTPMLTSRILFLFLVVSWEVRIGSTRHELSFSQSVPKPAGQVPPHLGYVHFSIFPPLASLLCTAPCSKATVPLK